MDRVDGFHVGNVDGIGLGNGFVEGTIEGRRDGPTKTLGAVDGSAEKYINVRSTGREFLDGSIGTSISGNLLYIRALVAARHCNTTAANRKTTAFILWERNISGVCSVLAMDIPVVTWLVNIYL